VKSVQNPTLDCFVGAVTESCRDLTDFVRLAWEGLTFEFPETPRREVVIFRGVELSDAALESYREIVGRFRDAEASMENLRLIWMGILLI
jgi:hypothetical protein